MKRCPSETRSTSTATVSTACSSRSNRCAASFHPGGIAGFVERRHSSVPTTPRGAEDADDEDNRDSRDLSGAHVENLVDIRTPVDVECRLRLIERTTGLGEIVLELYEEPVVENASCARTLAIRARCTLVGARDRFRGRGR